MHAEAEYHHQHHKAAAHGYVMPLDLLGHDQSEHQKEDHHSKNLCNDHRTTSIYFSLSQIGAQKPTLSDSGQTDVRQNASCRVRAALRAAL